MMTTLFTTGYSKPVIALRDKAEIKEALKFHFMITAVLAEINVFGDGLKVLGVLDYILKYPVLMRPHFVDEQTSLKAVKPAVQLLQIQEVHPGPHSNA